MGIPTTMSGTSSLRSVWSMGPGRLRRSPAALLMGACPIPRPSCHSKWLVPGGGAKRRNASCAHRKRAPRKDRMHMAQQRTGRSRGGEPRIPYTGEKCADAASRCWLAACSLGKPGPLPACCSLYSCSSSLLRHAHSTWPSAGSTPIIAYHGHTSLVLRSRGRPTVSVSPPVAMTAPFRYGTRRRAIGS